MKDTWGFDRVRIERVRKFEVIQVIKTIGEGKNDDPVRRTYEYWSLDGKLLAETDGSK